MLAKVCQDIIHGQDNGWILRTEWMLHQIQNLLAPPINPEHEAAEQLAAAAPDLLAACELAELWLVNCVPVTHICGPRPLPVIRAAIAKAVKP